MRKKILTTLMVVAALSLTSCGTTNTQKLPVDKSTSKNISTETNNTETTTQTVRDSIVDNYTGELGDAKILKQDSGFSYDNKDYPISCRLSRFLDNTDYVIDEESEKVAKERIDSYGRFSVMLRDKDGNDVGVSFNLLKSSSDEDGATETDALDLKNCKITDFDFDSVKFGSYEDGAKLREAHPVRVPGGATWDSTLEDLMRIYGKPTQITPVQDSYTYYEFEYKDLDRQITYELIAYYQKGATTPYRYIYSVIR